MLVVSWVMMLGIGMWSQAFLIICDDSSQFDKWIDLN